MRIAITGANGFVGKELVKIINDSENELIVFGRSNSEQYTEFYDYSLLSQPDKLKEIRPIDSFIHLAWGGSSGEARFDTKMQFENVFMGVEAVEAASSLGVTKFVGIGSITEKEVVNTILTKDTSPSGGFLYGSAKLAAYDSMRFAASRKNMEFVWIQLGNAIGVNDTSNRMFIQSIKKFLNNEIMEFSSGQQNFDFVSVKDAALGIYQSAIAGVDGKVYYLGSKKPRKLKELLEIAHSIANPEAPLSFAPISSFNGNGNIPLAGFSISQAEEDFGYSPTTSFEQIVKEIVEWETSK